MWTNFGKSVSKTGAKIASSTSVAASAAASVSPVRLDSGMGGLQVKKWEISRQDKIAEILNKVRQRDGLVKIPSHVEHLVGRVSASEKDLPGLNLAEKTQLILQSNHPVRHVLEREIYNNSKQHMTYYDWLVLFGRGIKASKDPKYEEVLNFISRSSDSGMFSSEIHQTIVDIPEDYKPLNTLTQYSLGNKYAVLVGDYFAIRCIYYVEKAKNNKALVAITRGLEQFTTSSFTTNFLDSSIIYPLMPLKTATVEDWIRYNRKASGYFTGGLYAILVANHDGLPKDEKVLHQMKRFSSNLAVLLKGVADIDLMENVRDFSYIPTSILTTLPAILYQQKNPDAFDSFRQHKMSFQLDFKQIVEALEKSSIMDEAKFVVGELAEDTKKSFDAIASDAFYGAIVQDLVEVIGSSE